MKPSLSIFAGLCALSSVPAATSAQVQMDVEQPVAILFQPFQSLPAGETMGIRITNPDAEAFTGQIEIEPTDATEFNWTCGDPIMARIVDQAAQLQAGRYSIPVQISPESETALSLRWRPENRAFIEPGRCDMLVNIRLLDTLGERLAEFTEVPIALQVAPDTSLSIAGTSGSVNAERTFAFIDFGTLETGERAFILFGAKANTDVEFTISSENDGAMVSLDDPSHRIDYVATFDGTPLPLSTEQILRRRPDRSLGGSNFRLDIQVGDVTGAFSGNYQDNLVVEMVAQ